MISDIDPPSRESAPLTVPPQDPSDARFPANTAHYKNISLLACRKDILLNWLFHHISEQSSFIIAPVHLRDLLIHSLLPKNPPWLQSQHFALPLGARLQKAIAQPPSSYKKDSQRPPHQAWQEVLIGEIFIDLTEKLLAENIPLLIWGLTKPQEEQLRVRLSLLLTHPFKSVFLFTHMETTYSTDELKTFIEKVNPPVVYITRASLKKFPQAHTWTQKSTFIIFDEPLALYSTQQHRNPVLVFVKRVFSVFLPWKWFTAIASGIILSILKKRSRPFLAKDSQKHEESQK